MSSFITDIVIIFLCSLLIRNYCKWNAQETIWPCFKLLGKNRPVGLYQTTNFCMAKQTIDRMKRQLTKSEKIFTNHHLRKDKFSKCTRNFYKSIQKQTSNQTSHVLNCAKDLDKCFSKDGIQMANRYMERCSS